MNQEVVPTAQKTRILSLRARDRFGMPLRVVGLLTARAVRMVNMTMVKAEGIGHFRFTIEILADQKKATHILKQMRKMSEVVSAQDVTESPPIWAGKRRLAVPA